MNHESTKRDWESCLRPLNSILVIVGVAYLQANLHGLSILAIYSRCTSQQTFHQFLQDDPDCSADFRCLASPVTDTGKHRIISRTSTMSPTATTFTTSSPETHPSKLCFTSASYNCSAARRAQGRAEQGGGTADGV